VYERDNFTCQKCGSVERLCIDHIKPRAAEGNNELENLQVLCVPCNAKKTSWYNGKRYYTLHIYYRKYEIDFMHKWKLYQLQRTRWSITCSIPEEIESNVLFQIELKEINDKKAIRQEKMMKNLTVRNKNFYDEYDAIIERIKIEPSFRKKLLMFAGMSEQEANKIIETSNIIL